MKKLFSVLTIVLMLGAIAACKKSGSASDEAIKNYILNHPEVLVQSLEKYQREQSQVDQQKAQEGVKTHAAEIFNDPNSPVVGNPNGKNVIVEFFDYNCHYCKGVLPDVQRIIAENKDVKVIFKELAILGPTSATTAVAALAVHDMAPEKYFAFHAALMEYKGAADNNSIAAAAEKAGIDPAALEQKVKDKKYQKILNDNVQLAQTLGINGTPTFIINGKLIMGAMGYQNMKAELANNNAADKK